MKYMKDFRELFGWDFTQFSCFNQSDTMLLVSSVKTTDYMDRRGYMAIMSLIHGKKLRNIRWWVFDDNLGIISIFLLKDIHCGYSLSTCQGNSSVYPQHMLSLRIEYNNL